MRHILIIAILLLGGFSSSKTQAQENDNQKVIFITLDGFRWQELFTGADALLIGNKKYVEDADELKEKFWKPTAKERRETLMPFVWNTVNEIGQIHGNRLLGSKMNLTNGMWFSYPGYNEILTGKADDKRITSNKKIDNPNTTILEIANKTQKYKGKVAAFGSWDVFPYIINEKRSGVPVNAGFELAKGNNLTEKELFLNRLQPKVPSPWGSVRLDAFTHYYALEHMKKTHPDVVYISYGETDDFAHDGDYSAYLQSAQTTDTLLKELWEYVESDVYYKGKTTFIITTDHGRGTRPLKTWKSHGSDIDGADQVWVIAFGAKVKPLGEIATKEQLFTNQTAATVAKLLEIKMTNTQAGKPFKFLNY